jgi:hypothetical protein
MHCAQGELGGLRSSASTTAMSLPNFTSASSANYLLLCVAVLFVIFQMPLILSRLWKSINSFDPRFQLS